MLALQIYPICAPRLISAISLEAEPNGGYGS